MICADDASLSLLPPSTPLFHFDDGSDGTNGAFMLPATLDALRASAALSVVPLSDIQLLNAPDDESRRAIVPLFYPLLERVFSSPTCFKSFYLACFLLKRRSFILSFIRESFFPLLLVKGLLIFYSKFKNVFFTKF